MRAKCKLALNQEQLIHEHRIEDGEIHAVREGKLPRNLVISYCLNCDEAITHFASNPLIFCSGKCADEYNKRKRGLI